jgi:crossover junction endodeoxyribonuclease RusA
MEFDTTSIRLAVSLPWPSAKLNPNRSKGVHWAASYGLRTQARQHALTVTLEAMLERRVIRGSSGPLALTITFIQPDRRARDRDNLLAALKPSLDGLADALGVNDAQFEPVLLRREYGTKPGSVLIEIGGPQ